MSWGTKHLVNREKNKGENKKGCSSGRKYSTILFVNYRDLHKVHHISIGPYYILIIERPRNDICKSNIARIFMSSPAKNPTVIFLCTWEKATTLMLLKRSLGSLFLPLHINIYPLLPKLRFPTFSFCMWWQSYVTFIFRVFILWYKLSR